MHNMLYFAASHIARALLISIACITLLVPVSCFLSVHLASRISILRADLHILSDTPEWLDEARIQNDCQP